MDWDAIKAGNMGVAVYEASRAALSLVADSLNLVAAVETWRLTAAAAWISLTLCACVFVPTAADRAAEDRAR